MSASIPPFTGPPPALSPGQTNQPDTRSLQRFLDNALAGTQLKFRVDTDVGRVVVQVIDVQSGEVVRQIPRDEALKIARAALDESPEQAAALAYASSSAAPAV